VREGLAEGIPLPDASVDAVTAADAGEHPHFDGPPWQDAVRAAGGWTAPREIRVTTSQPAHRERMVDYLASMSWIAAMPDDQRAETLAQVGALVEAGETPDELPVHVVIGVTASADPG